MGIITIDAICGMDVCTAIMVCPRCRNGVNALYHIVNQDYCKYELVCFACFKLITTGAWMRTEPNP